MKPIPNFTKHDFNLLSEMIKNSINVSNSKDLLLLKQELERGAIHKDDAVEEKFIKINSNVVIEDLATKREMKFQIVLPSMANIKEQKVSVLATLSIAVIGFKENDEIEWDLPGGKKMLKIKSID
ncbi:GreA/GreB family elongation factor [Flavobacterium sp. HXWNR69]|uniref:GreA/GreB family elongation factor n=1 Tax=Flavobacterium fragile TaxID=2949085 RepID=A0ABT0TJX2_9FLAO|nr:GreA/GreB family elongation factor [Flavobacterium sp. HXWNR69]MCL9771107.1 GreA/GreB family elongation factor [Flavobacterium sp. HXWNR69]